jgi:ATP-dependent Clp protease, protease subunit
MRPKANQPPQPWYRITAKADGEAEILIYDEIVDPLTAAFWGIGISAKSFAKELKDLGELTALTIRINSPGGAVFEGQAIYSLLKNHKARKTVYVDGLAASIASVIAMAGDEVIVPENALLMIHNPSALVWGTAEDMVKMADDLGKITESIIAVYAAKTGKEHAAIAKLMDEETWMTGADAVEQGFADRQTEAVQVAARFDVSQFKHVPAALAAKAKPERKPEPVTHVEEEPMDITVDIVTSQAPAVAQHFTDQGKTAGKKEGEQAERARVVGIFSAMLPGQEVIAQELIKIGASAEEAAKTFKARKLGELTEAAPKTTGGGGGPDAPALSALSGDELFKAEWDQNKGSVQQEFTDEASYLAFRRAEASGRTKILGDKK